MSSVVLALIRPPSDLAERLRELADQVDAGRLTDAIVAYVSDGNYDFIYGASLHQCIVLSSLLNQNCIDRTRA